MTAELKTAIESLYSTFLHYPRNLTLDGCPCCVSGERRAKFHVKTLWTLEAEDLAPYVLKGISRWGKIEDFKHYLPRIFELLATTGFSIDNAMVFRKLQTGNWTDWESEEKDAVKAFLLAWWADSMENRFFDTAEFHALYALLEDIEILFEHWPISLENHSFQNMVHCIRYYYSRLINQNSPAKVFPEHTTQQLLAWMSTQKEQLRTGIDHFEGIDPSFAKKIADTLNMLEQHPWEEQQNAHSPEKVKLKGRPKKNIPNKGYVYFSIGSYVLKKEDFLTSLGMPPDTFGFSGLGVNKPRLNWKITTPMTQNLDLFEMTRDIMYRLMPIKDRLIALKKAHPDLDYVLELVFWIGNDSTPALYFENDLFLFFGEIGARFDCDMYLSA
jgi:Domain of unknown function (DUF4279)